MNKKEYLNKLEKKYENYFKIYKNKNVLGENIDLFAHYYEEAGRTFITQKDIIDRFEINEYCLVKTFEKIDNSIFENFCDYGKKLTKDLVKPHSEHRSSVITLVMISDNLLKENTLKLLGKFKYTKYYKFYFHGFSQVKVVLVDLFNNRVYCSKNAKLLRKTYS